MVKRPRNMRLGERAENMAADLVRWGYGDNVSEVVRLAIRDAWYATRQRMDQSSAETEAIALRQERGR